VKKWLVLCALLAVPQLAQAQRPQQQRREQLEAQIAQRFLNHVATELALEPNTRTRLEQHLRESGPVRRRLAQSTVQLRGRILRAVRDDATPDSEFARLINEMTRLRDEEETLWKSDQDALRRILTPRQHARFIVMWIRFNEQVRDMAMKRGGPAQNGLRQP
jgi:Spy/CpxP family protein refolding chaperone